MRDRSINRYINKEKERKRRKKQRVSETKDR